MMLLQRGWVRLRCHPQEWPTVQRVGQPVMQGMPLAAAAGAEVGVEGVPLPLLLLLLLLPSHQALG